MSLTRIFIQLGAVRVWLIPTLFNVLYDGDGRWKSRIGDRKISESLSIVWLARSASILIIEELIDGVIMNRFWNWCWLFLWNYDVLIVALVSLSCWLTPNISEMMTMMTLMHRMPALRLLFGSTIVGQFTWFSLTELCFMTILVFFSASNWHETKLFPLSSGETKQFKSFFFRYFSLYSRTLSLLPLRARQNLISTNCSRQTKVFLVASRGGRRYLIGIKLFFSPRSHYHENINFFHSEITLISRTIKWFTI